MSLTTTSKKFRKGIKILGIFAFLYYLAILFIIPQSKEFLLNLFVDRNPPNPIFGKLDQLGFVKNPTRNESPQIILDTKDGRLPAGLPRKMTVYKFKPQQYSYLAGKNAQQDADTLGFSSSELISDLKGSQYQWRSLTSGGLLIINTDDRSMLLTTDLYGKTGEYKAGSIDYESAKQFTVNILKRLNRYSESIYNPANFKVTLGHFIGSTMVDTKVVSDAQIARVDVYGKVGDYNIFGPDPKEGLIWMILRNPIKENSPYNYPYIEGYFWDVDTKSDASYPIIPVQDAWKQVLAGKGVITSVYPKNANPFGVKASILMEKVLVNKIYLAYYVTRDFQKHMQPIYVFEGNYTATGTEGGDVTIYYPAITAEYINTRN